MRREVIFEIEQVKRLRKRAWSKVIFCDDCGREADFITLGQAAEIFEHDHAEFAEFLTANGCHTQIYTAETYICLIAMLDAIGAIAGNSRRRYIGD